jgi:hypothetical protein
MRLGILLVFFVLLMLLVTTSGWLYWRHLERRRVRLGEHGFVKRALLTGNEIDFYRRLLRVLGRDFAVLPQVSMGALMATTLTPDHPDYWPVRESFASKIIDFVVCDSKTFDPLLVVELDDRMHDFARDRTRDALVSRCGLRTVRFWSRKKPDDDTLRAELYRWLGNAVDKCG